MEAPFTRFIDLDGAWPADILGAGNYLDRHAWGPRVRYCAPAREIEAFWAETSASVAPFTLYGSGDYHHLSALWLRQLSEPFTLVSFDNHPDWDTRPPAWCCGTWLNQAFKQRQLEAVVVWGCANFELNPPHRWFGNQKAVASGRLILMPWRDRFGRSAQRRYPGIVAGTWRAEFTRLLGQMRDRTVYVTIDMDCLRPGDAVTDWEQGLFTVEDVAWALNELRRETRVIGGDLCGAHSPASYARWTQRKNATMDHPKKPPVDRQTALRTNLRAFHRIWPALTGRSGNA
ncbi:MAG: hypothetical protein JOY92_10720 [Verrucomicrobia bacterium]|nr:hypothetical protein [Verrucomicrobiota bacterium]